MKGTSWSDFGLSVDVRESEAMVPVVVLRIMHQSDTVGDCEPAEAVSKEVSEVARQIYCPTLSHGRIMAEALSRARHMRPFEHRLRAGA